MTTMYNEFLKGKSIKLDSSSMVFNAETIRDFIPGVLNKVLEEKIPYVEEEDGLEGYSYLWKLGVFMDLLNSYCIDGKFRDLFFDLAVKGLKQYHCTDIIEKFFNYNMIEECEAEKVYDTLILALASTHMEIYSTNNIGAYVDRTLKIINSDKYYALRKAYEIMDEDSRLADILRRAAWRMNINELIF